MGFDGGFNYWKLMVASSYVSRPEVKELLHEITYDQKFIMQIIFFYLNVIQFEIIHQLKNKVNMMVSLLQPTQMPVVTDLV